MTVADLKVLVENINEYIHVPGGIERLKKTVLHLAVSGQLVPQIPREGSGEDLYKQIQSVHKPKKPLPDVEDTPFEIPDSWKWANLAEVVEINMGRTPSRSESKYWGNDMPWVSIADLSDNNHISETKERVSNLGLEKCFKGTAVPSGTLLYSFKLTIGKMSITDMDAVHNEAIASLVTYSPITTEYLFKALKIIDPLSKTNSAVMGKTLNSQSLAVIEVPLPPLAEQKRIIGKVNEIFAIIDELDSKYKAEEAERGKFVRSSLRALSHDNSTLALENLARTVKTKVDATELRKAILHLAVSGQLVPQIPAEGVGKDLIKHIQDIYRPKKPLPKASEVPFDVPSSWSWTRLGELFDITSSKRVMQADWKSTGVPFLRARDLTNAIKTGRVVSDIFVSEIYYEETAKSSGVPKAGDIMISGVGTIGTPYAVKDDDKFYFKDATILWFRNPAKVFVGYVEMVFHSAFMKSVIMGQSQGTTVNTYTIANARLNMIPLPPLAEQKRIVQKTTELLSLVTELEKHLEE